MMPENKKAIGIGILLLVIGAAFGRFSAPEKVRTETKVVTVEKKSAEDNSSSEASRDRHKTTTTREIIHPDGTKETVTTTTEDSQTGKKSSSSSKSSEESSQSSTQTKEVTRNSSPVTVSLLVGTNISLSNGTGPLIYGGQVSRPLLGPVNVGIWGMSNSTGGVSVGLSF